MEIDYMQTRTHCNSFNQSCVIKKNREYSWKLDNHYIHIFSKRYFVLNCSV